jgi:DnaJ-class molecular chaperone
MDVYRQASDGYERSKQDAEEISTVYTPKNCEACGGTGYRVRDKKKKVCSVCKGEGFTLAENVTRKVKGQAGDPQFLRIKIEVMRELNKMKGHYSDSGRLGSGNTFVNIKGDVDMELVSRMDEKTLIKAMELLDEIKENKPQEEEEPIDVEVKKIEGGDNTLS